MLFCPFCSLIVLSAILQFKASDYPIWYLQAFLIYVWDGNNAQYFKTENVQNILDHKPKMIKT